MSALTGPAIIPGNGDRARHRRCPMLAGMITALAAARIAPAFNPGFYTVAATVIPVLFLALIFEGRFIGTLLSASQQAADTIGELMGAYALVVLIKLAVGIFSGPKPESAPPRKPPGPLSRWWHNAIVNLEGRGMQAAILAALAAAMVPALLAVGIVVFGIGGEITAVVSLYSQHAPPWTGTFDLTSLVFLIALTGIPAAALLTQAAFKVYRENKPAKPAASAAENTGSPAPPQSTPDGTSDSPAAQPAPKPPSAGNAPATS
jgi:hypothetical protein